MRNKQRVLFIAIAVALLFAGCKDFFHSKPDEGPYGPDNWDRLYSSTNPLVGKWETISPQEGGYSGPATLYIYNDGEWRVEEYTLSSYFYASSGSPYNWVSTGTYHMMGHNVVEFFNTTDTPLTTGSTDPYGTLIMMGIKFHK